MCLHRNIYTNERRYGMNKKCCSEGREIPISELGQQLDYARTISSDICRIFSCRTPNITKLLNDYETVRIKLSMLEDFLFQAKLWCNTLTADEECPRKCEEIIKEEE